MTTSRSKTATLWVDLAALLALIGLTIAFFWKMAFTDLILPRGDAFAYFYPYWAYRNAALRAGRLPLWNPYLFMGAPFLANSQAGVFYPPNWALIPFDAPTAIKVAILLHVGWAATGMFLFSRRTIRLSTLAATLAGAVFGLGGYLTAQVEHINQLQGLAWLPWLFWLWSEAMAGRRRAFFGLGLALAMQLLAGHSQSAFISGMGLGLWAAWHTIGRWREIRRGAAGSDASLPDLLAANWKQLAWPLGGLALASAVALGVAAAQILPTLELARLSNRGGGLSFLEAVSFSFKPHFIGRGLLPSYGEASLFSEYVAYVGVIALMLALIGGWERRRERQVMGLIGLAGVGLFLALGAYNPVYWALVRFVPGFDLFRAPARWLAVWGFGTAALVGVGFDRLMIPAPQSDSAAKPLKALWPGAVVIVLGGLSFLAPLTRDNVVGATAPGGGEVGIWMVTLAAGLGAIWWIRRSRPAARRYALPALAALVVVELFIASRNLPYNDLSAPAAWYSQRPAISTLLASEQGSIPPARFLSISDTLFDPGDLREIEAIYGPHLTEDALFDYIVATKEKEILAPNLPMAWGIYAMDGFDGGILPTRDYTRFTALFLDEDEVTPDGRLRENLSAVPDLRWLRLANVGWIITDKVYDAWIDGVYYDLQFAERVVSGETGPTEAYPLQPFEATAVGIVGHLEGAAALADGTIVGSVTIIAGGKPEVSVSLVVGEDLAEGLYSGAAHSQPEVAGAFTPDEPELVEYHTLIEWDTPLRVERVSVTTVPAFRGALVVRGVSLIDGRSGAFMPTSVARGNAIRLAHSGDVKIYEYRYTLPRAYLVCEPEFVESEGEVWALLEAYDGQITVIEEPEPPEATTCDPALPGEVTITHYAPERTVMQVKSQGEGVYVVLSDAWYPGWVAWVGETRRFTPVRRANGLFRAVPVPPGENVVTFTYQSRPLQIGTVISIESVLIVLLGLLLRWSPGDRAGGRSAD